MNVTGHTRGGSAASIRDVATAAGVSYQTVSRVINGHPSVKPSTRERVLAAIEELGFRRSATALALASGRSPVGDRAHRQHHALRLRRRSSRASRRPPAPPSYAVGIGVLESADEAAVAGPRCSGPPTRAAG